MRCLMSCTPDKQFRNGHLVGFAVVRCTRRVFHSRSVSRSISRRSLNRLASDGLELIRKRLDELTPTSVELTGGIHSSPAVPWRSNRNARSISTSRSCLVGTKVRSAARSNRPSATNRFMWRRTVSRGISRQRHAEGCPRVRRRQRHCSAHQAGNERSFRRRDA